MHTIISLHPSHPTPGAGGRNFMVQPMISHPQIIGPFLEYPCAGLHVCVNLCWVVAASLGSGRHPSTNVSTTAQVTSGQAVAAPVVCKGHLQAVGTLLLLNEGEWVHHALIKK